MLSTSQMTLTQIFLQRVKIIKLKSHYITILTLPNSASYAIQSRKRLNYNIIILITLLKKKSVVERSILFARKPVRLE